MVGRGRVQQVHETKSRISVQLSAKVSPTLDTEEKGQVSVERA